MGFGVDVYLGDMQEQVFVEGLVLVFQVGVLTTKKMCASRLWSNASSPFLARFHTDMVV